MKDLLFSDLGKSFGEIFPFYICFNADLKVIAAGKSLRKIISIPSDAYFNDLFSISRPGQVVLSAVALESLEGQVFILKSLEQPLLTLRGQMVLLKNKDFVFMGSPWITNVELLQELDINLTDFALHDSIPDMIHFLKAMQIEQNDINILYQRLQLKTKELSESGEKISRRNQELLTLINHIQAGVLMEDENRRIILVNQEFCDLLGFDMEPDKMVGFDCRQSVGRVKHLFSNPDRFEYRINKLLTEKKMQLNEEIEMKDGRCLERSFIPLINGLMYIGHLWIYRDITLKKQEREVLLAAKETAISVLQDKNDFIANISHELRTPVSIISSMAQLMQETALTKNQKEYLDVISATSSTMVSLVNDILEYEKIEAKKIDVRIELFDIKAVLQNIIRNFKYQAAQKDLLLTLHVDNNVPKYISFDPLRMEQIVINLVNNAIKFTRKGTVKVNCSFQEKQGRQEIRLNVTDTGIGIPSSELPHLFDRFWRSEKSNRIYAGSGLGLPIVKSIVDVFDGKVEVQSEVGVGSSFTIVLPVMGVSNHSNHNGQLSLETKDLDLLKGISVLIAEDNPNIQLILERILQKYGMNPKVVDNGLQALQALQESSFDLVMVDIQMPLMDGYETIRNIRNDFTADKTDIPIIVISANAVIDYKDNYDQLGVNGYILKPFTHDDLIQKIYQVSVKDRTRYRICNFDYLKSVDAGDPQFYVQLLNNITDQVPALFDKMQQACRENDPEKLSKASHKLKSSIQFIGAHEQVKILDKLEHIPQDSLLSEETKKMVDDFKNAWQFILSEIESEKKVYHSSKKQSVDSF